MGLLRRRFASTAAVVLLGALLVLPLGASSAPHARAGAGDPRTPSAAAPEFVNLSDIASSWSSDFGGVAWPQGPFSAIAIRLTLENYGDPWDRADWVDVDNVTLLDVTTLENTSDNNPVQSFQVNITDYSVLFADPGYVWWQAMPNWISPCDSGLLGCWTGVLSFEFTPGPAPSGLPSSIVPVLPFATLTTTAPSVNGTLEVPGSFARAEAVLFQEGQGNDEFWYAQAIGSRELRWQWDNQTVLAVLPLPFLNSGGALGGSDDLYEWNGTPAPGTGARPSVEVDLTPWLALLAEGPSYNFTVLNNDNSWQIGLALFLWAAVDERTPSPAASRVLDTLGSRAGSIEGWAESNTTEPFAVESYNLTWSQYLNITASSFDVASSSRVVDQIVSSSVVVWRQVVERSVFEVRLDSGGAVHIAVFANWSNTSVVTGNGQDANLTTSENLAWTIDGASGGLASTEAFAATGASRGQYSAPPVTFAGTWGSFENRTAKDGVGVWSPIAELSGGSASVPLPGRFVVAPAAGPSLRGPVIVDLLVSPMAEGAASVSFGPGSVPVGGNDTVVVNVPSLTNGTHPLNVSAPTWAGASLLSVPLVVTGWTPPYVSPLTVVASAPTALGEAPWFATFNASATGGTGPFRWVWMFGDGTTADLENTTHLYAGSGNYAANVTATDSDGRTAHAEVDVFVYPGLAVGIAGPAVPWAVGRPVDLTANISGGFGPYNVSWGSVPAGCAGATSTVLSCTPTAVGLFSVRLVVTDALGRSAVAWQNGTILAGPGAPAPLNMGAEIVVGAVAVVLAVVVIVALLTLRRPRGRTPP